MWRWLIAVSVLVATPAWAAPHRHVASRDPAFATAEKLWSAAKDPAGWRAAADAFFALAETATDADKVAAARSGWAAARNALAKDVRVEMEPGHWDRKPVAKPLSEPDAWFVQRAERYEQLDRGAPDAVVAEFIRANTLRHYDQLEPANALYLDIVATHRDQDVAEYAANLACDTFVQLGQFDKLLAFVDQLRTDKPFLARFPDLAHTLRAIHLK